MTNQNKIECLASFIITGIYDETFLYVGYELQTFKMELLQYRLVLDYLTTKKSRDILKQNLKFIATTTLL